MAMHTDPVCGMQIDDKDTVGQSTYNGQIYGFCSAECQRKFDENPQRYAERAGGATSGNR